MATFSDAFTRADGTLGSDWDSVTSRSTLRIISNKCRGQNGVIAVQSVATATATFAADQQASILVDPKATDDFMGPCVRVDAAAGTGYGVRGDGNTGNNQTLFRFNSSEFTFLSTGFAIANSDTLMVRIVGTTLSAWVNGVQVRSVTDATYATGQPGLYYNWLDSGVGRMDTFQADDVSSGPDAATLAAYRRTHLLMVP